MGFGIRDAGILMTVAACAALGFAIWLAQPKPGAQPTLGNFSAVPRHNTKIRNQLIETRIAAPTKSPPANRPAPEIEVSNDGTD